MHKDLSQAPSIQEFAVNEFVIMPGQNEDVFVVPVGTNEIVQVIFDYTIHDRMNRCARVGSFQVMANGREAVPDPVPAAHVTTDAYGEEPQNLQIDVRSSGNVLQFRATNSYTQQELILVSAKVKVVHVPATSRPRIRLTITGMTGPQNINGLGNGVHIVEPFLYYRSPYGGSAVSYFPTITTSFTFSTGTQCELWGWAKTPPGPPTSSWDGVLQFGVSQGAPSSLANVLWNNGITVYATTITFTTFTGFARDRVLSGSFAVGPVTFVWEREPTDPSNRWGQY